MHHDLCFLQAAAKASRLSLLDCACISDSSLDPSGGEPLSLFGESQAGQIVSSDEDGRDEQYSSIGPPAPLPLSLFG